MIPGYCEDCIWWDSEHSTLTMIEFPYEAKWGYCMKHKPGVLPYKNKLIGDWPLVDSRRGCGEYRKGS